MKRHVHFLLLVTLGVILAGCGGGGGGSSTSPNNTPDGSTKTALTLSTTSAKFGQPLTLSAVVTSASSKIGVPQGSVNFEVNGVTFATVPLSNGQAVLTSNLIPVGSDSISAVYVGDTTFLSSASQTIVSHVTGVKIMPLGDSITMGYSTDPTSVAGYRKQLWDMTTGKGWGCQYVGEVVYGPGYLGACQGNFGYATALTTELVPRVMAKYQPDIILLQIGTNDFGRFDETYQQAVTQMGTLLDTIIATAPHAQLYVASPTWQPNSWYQDRFLGFNNALPRLVAARAAKGYHIQFVDMYTLTNFGPSDLSSGSHPNAIGYAKMANVWYSVLQGLPIPGK